MTKKGESAKPTFAIMHIHKSWAIKSTYYKKVVALRCMEGFKTRDDVVALCLTHTRKGIVYTLEVWTAK